MVDLILVLGPEREYAAQQQSRVTPKGHVNGLANLRPQTRNLGLGLWLKCRGRVRRRLVAG